MKSLFSSTSGGSYRSVLGVHVTRGEVRAALVREVDGGVALVDRFHRYRGGKDGDAAGSGEDGASEVGTGGEGGVADADYTIEFGNQGGGSATGGDEFGGGSSGEGLGGLESGSPGGEIEAGAHPDRERSRPPFDRQLEEIVAECTEAHGSEFDVVFLSEAWGTEFRRLEAGSDGEEGESPEQLLERLNRERDEEIPGERVIFQRLAGTRRSGKEVLALIRGEDDSVVETIDALRGGRTDALPGTLGLVGEPTLFGRLLEEDGVIASEGTLALVRVGADDTLVLFFEDGELVEQELLKSLSVNDPPDTVCKRILLHQDEAGIDAPDRIWVLADGREEAFTDRFAALNPEVGVRSFYEVIRSGMGDAAGEAGSRAPAIFAEAQALAWDVLVHDGIEEDQNLLPAGLRGRRAPIRLGWHTWAAAVLLFAVSLFLAGEFRAKQNRVDTLQTEIAQYPSGLEMTTEQLQSQIDSLRSVYSNYSESLDALDSLLVDSDRWSRMLAQVVRTQDETPGVWFEAWSPGRPDRLTLRGYATERDRVVEVANRLDAAVEQIAFDQIRSYPVYRFTMSAPLPGGLPNAVRYLREQDSLATDTTQVVSTSES